MGAAIATGLLSPVAALVSAARLVPPPGSPPADVAGGRDSIVVIFAVAIALNAIAALVVWRHRQRWAIGLFASILTFVMVNGVSYGYGDVDSRSSAAALLAGSSVVAWVATGVKTRGARSTS